jgi:hypothetical protein
MPNSEPRPMRKPAKSGNDFVAEEWRRFSFDESAAVAWHNCKA